MDDIIDDCDRDVLFAEPLQQFYPEGQRFEDQPGQCRDADGYYDGDAEPLCL